MHLVIKVFYGLLVYSCCVACYWGVLAVRTFRCIIEISFDVTSVASVYVFSVIYFFGCCVYIVVTLFVMWSWKNLFSTMITTFELSSRFRIVVLFKAKIYKSLLLRVKV